MIMAFEKFCWTSARIERLKELWTEGHSARDVGAELGCSRNAVIGKVHREGLQSGPSKHRHGGHNRRVYEPRFGQFIPRRPPIPKPVQMPVRLFPVKILDLKTHHCRFVLGEPAGLETMFCGAPKHQEFSWCLPHLLIVRGKGRVPGSPEAEAARAAEIQRVRRFRAAMIAKAKVSA